MLSENIMIIGEIMGLIQLLGPVFFGLPVILPIDEVLLVLGLGTSGVLAAALGVTAVVRDRRAKRCRGPIADTPA